MNIPGTTALDAMPAVMDDGDLVARMRIGDEQAFADVVRRFGPRMLAVARRFLRHEEDAQDAVQDAFLSAFKSIDQFQGQSRLATWLHRIVVNAALMNIRARRRHPEKPIDDLLPKFKEDGHAVQPATQWAVAYDTAVGSRETREFVRASIQQLPDSYRTILLLRDIEEKSTDEAAELLGISSGAVKTRLHRARQALRTLLDSHMRGATA